MSIPHNESLGGFQDVTFNGISHSIFVNNFTIFQPIFTWNMSNESCDIWHQNIPFDFMPLMKIFLWKIEH